MDRYSGKSYWITTSAEAALYGGNIVRVKTYRDVLAEYLTHPEAKSLDPDGEVCSRQTIGLLQRRPVTRSSLSYVGKESNKLEEVEAGLVYDPEEVYTMYADPEHDPWRTVVVPILKRMPRRQLAELTGLSERQIAAIRNGHARPHTQQRAVLLHVAGDYGLLHAERTSATMSPGHLEACAAYLSRLAPSSRTASPDL